MQQDDIITLKGKNIPLEEEILRHLQHDAEA